jgi:hypothetical protein
VFTDEQRAHGVPNIKNASVQSVTSNTSTIIQPPRLMSASFPPLS